MEKLCARISFSLLSILSLISTTTYAALSQSIDPPGERLVLIDPRYHEWGAYDENGNLLRSGVASTGKSFCEDIGRPCFTDVGSFRVRSLGDKDCKSPSFPLPKGGAPMPYCMYYNDVQALHGSYEVARKHLSHGCVRMSVSDAKWLRFNFVEVGTLVTILPY